MAGRIEERLKELRIELPRPSKPGANYVPFVRTGALVFITGQLSQWNGDRRFIGEPGSEFTAEEGQRAARLCALNLIAQSQVLNGASDVIVEVFAEAGRHAGMAVGVSALAYDVAAEVEAILEVE